MIDFCINRNDRCTTILFQVEVQACDPGATASISSSEDNVEGRYDSDSTAERDQAKVQYDLETADPGSGDGMSLA